ncbi:MAG: M56 family metallopeptidase [Defluviitaleaceae bacterium]|nr:M56 family metallopeptidase [Defluviitaleaceae bacterium]
MAELLRAVLVMSLTGSVISFLLLGLKPFVRHRLPKYTQYYLWLVVIAALLIPVSRLITVSGSQSTIIPAVPSITETVSRFVITQAEETQRLESMAPLAVSNPPVYQLERPAVQGLIPLITTYFVVIYPFGVFILLLYYFIHYAVFLGLYRRRNIPTGPDIMAMLTDIYQGRPPRIYYNALAETPMLLGIFRPAIVLPNHDYTKAEMQAILSHELTHLRRKDVLVKWLTLLTTALHWFNPLIWLVRKEIDRACELSCDEAVTGNMDAHSLQHYGNTLLLVAANPKTPRAIASATMSENKNNLKERLGAIMKRRKHARYVIIFSMILILAALGLAACLGAGRDENTSTENQADEPYYETYIPVGYDEPYYEAYTPARYDEPADTQEVVHEPLITPAGTAPINTFESYHEADFRDENPSENDTAQTTVTHDNYVDFIPPAHDIPMLIQSDFDITIPYIAPGEWILLGVLDLEPGDTFRLNLQADLGRGAFVNVSNTPDPAIAREQGYWRGAIFGGGSHTQIYHYGYRYLFVGSTAVVPPDSQAFADAELFNVSVIFTVIDE